MLFSEFPQVNLGEYPTPLQPMRRWGELVGHDRLWIKRDDLDGLGRGGNKVRSLEFWLGEAEAENADVIIATGGVQSNQCRLTAAAASRRGIDCILVHNAARPTMYQGNLLLNHLAGAKMIFLGPVEEETRNRKAQRIAERLTAQGRRPYVVGESGLGAMGYAKAALEIHRQASRMGIDLKHVAIVGAMGTTAAGFLFGTALLGGPFSVHVISVEYGGDRLKRRLEKIFQRLQNMLDIAPRCSLDEVMSIYERYLGPGYAQPTQGSLQTVYDVARTEGIFLEQVYTSKTLWGMKGLIEEGIIPSSEAACYVHTGGGPALFAQADFFQPKGK